MTSNIQAQDFARKVQNYLYTCSSTPQFMAFLNKNHDKIRDYIVRHDLHQKRSQENLSQKDMLKTNVQRYIHGFKLSKEMNQPDMIYRRADYLFTIIGLSLNTAAFLNTIELLGSDEQGEKWRKQVLNGKAFGGYGQTQLGHGSNVQGLQTQAHYDQNKQVFRFKSPKVTSAKYWPGVIGLVSTHTVLQAKTFVKGESIGIQTFVFQMRDQNLRPLKGVKAGDIGPKFGFHRVDNGYLLIDNVQMPRDSMLMRYVQVTPDGQVIGKENKQAIKYAYGSMLYLRVALPFSFAFAHIMLPARNLYALYEQMGTLNQPENKKQLINYLCIAKGIIIANLFPQKLFAIFSAELKAKNFEKADKVLVKCHIISATFKALASWKALKVSTEIATRYQYTTFRTTSIPYSYNNIVPAVTYEGDNSVLLQQTARFILMKDKGEQLSKPKTTVRDDDMSSVIQMLKYVTSMEVRRLKKVFQTEFEAKIGFKTIWNERNQRDIIQVSKLWGVMQWLQGFTDTLKDMPSEFQPYFTKVGQVFAKNLLKDTPQIFTYGFVIEEVQSWKEFTDVEYWALSHIQRPIGGFYEQHKLLPRQGDWIRSKL